MRDTPQFTSAAGIVSYRAEITDGQQLRDRGLPDKSSDILFLFGADVQGEECEICCLEMSEEHGDELDELMESLPRSGALAVIHAMQARSQSLSDMIAVAKVVHRG